jgi:hypothetical protein
MSKSRMHKLARRADSATREIRYASFAQPGTSKDRYRKSNIKLRDKSSQRVGVVPNTNWEDIVAHTDDTF